MNLDSDYCSSRCEDINGLWVFKGGFLWHLWVVTVIIKWYLSMKEGSLFCFVVMRSTKLGCLQSCSWCLWKALDEEGAWAWFNDIWTCCAKVLEYWMISSLKSKLNRSWKIRRNWNVPFLLLERSWRAGFNGNYLVRFGFRKWEILIFKWFLPLKIQINSKKPLSVLEGKISWGRGNTWANSTSHTTFTPK